MYRWQKVLIRMCIQSGFEKVVFWWFFSHSSSAHSNTFGNK